MSFSQKKPKTQMIFVSSSDNTFSSLRDNANPHLKTTQSVITDKNDDGIGQNPATRANTTNGIGNKGVFIQVIPRASTNGVFSENSGSSISGFKDTDNLPFNKTKSFTTHKNGDITREHPVTRTNTTNGIITTSRVRFIQVMPRASTKSGLFSENRVNSLLATDIAIFKERDPNLTMGTIIDNPIGNTDANQNKAKESSVVSDYDKGTREGKTDKTQDSHQKNNRVIVHDKDGHQENNQRINNGNMHENARQNPGMKIPQYRRFSPVSNTESDTTLDSREKKYLEFLDTSSTLSDDSVLDMQESESLELLELLPDNHRFRTRSIPSSVCFQHESSAKQLSPNISQRHRAPIDYSRQGFRTEPSFGNSTLSADINLTNDRCNEKKKKVNKCTKSSKLGTEVNMGEKNKKKKWAKKSKASEKIIVENDGNDDCNVHTSLARQIPRIDIIEAFAADPEKRFIDRVKERLRDMFQTQTKVKAFKTDNKRDLEKEQNPNLTRFSKKLLNRAQRCVRRVRDAFQSCSCFSIQD